MLDFMKFQMIGMTAISYPVNTSCFISISIKGNAAPLNPICSQPQARFRLARPHDHTAA